jgi:CxxC motif-containing protein (DUF1111 family)
MIARNATRAMVRALTLAGTFLFLACNKSETVTSRTTGGGKQPAPAPVAVCTQQELGSPEALAGFDDRTNCIVAQATHNADRDAFDDVDTADADGLGPVYNAQACRECHQNPRSGAASQIHEFRAGHRVKNAHGDSIFVDADVLINNGRDKILHRNLINDRAICPEAQELVANIVTPAGNDVKPVRTNRLSLNVLGDGYVEAVDDNVLIALSQQQCAARSKICGRFLLVPILEKSRPDQPPVVRVGRFGWKDQHASLLSFSADAYLNEMGITNRLQPDEVTNVCNTFKTEPNDDENDIDKFARFMRATRVPPPNTPSPNTPAAARYANGSKQFDDVGCVTCHVRDMKTAPADIVFNKVTFPVPTALRNRRFHPFSDLLLHDIGTGDGVAISVTEHYGLMFGSRMLGQTAANVMRFSAATVQRRTTMVTQLLPAAAQRPPCVENPVATTDPYVAMENRIQCFATFLRTPPLWGVRVRSKLMHDGQSVTVEDAILRHRGEADAARKKFASLRTAAKADLLFFVSSQ